MTAIDHDPAGLLARLLDLRGSVELQRTLARPMSPAASVPSGAPGVVDLLSRARDELGAVRASVRRASQRWLAPRAHLVDVDTIVRALDAGGGVLDRSRRRVTAAARAILAPLSDEASREASLAWRAARAVRREIGVEIAALGPDAARLERLDAVIGEAIGASVEARVARIVPAMQPRLQRELGAAIDALPDVIDVAQVRPWLESGGVIERCARQLEGVALAAIEHEGRLIEALAIAAIELEGRS